MKRFICVAAFVMLWALPHQASSATLTATVEIPDPIVTEVLATVNAWRTAQVNDDGALKYPTLKALGNAILRDAIVRIITQQCSAEPDTCPTAIKAKLDVKKTARDEANMAISDSIVAP